MATGPESTSVNRVAAHHAVIRPWLEGAPKGVSRPTIDSWRQALAEGGDDNLGLDAGLGEWWQSGFAFRPGISVIVPTYMGKSHIGRCLKSLCSQTLPHELLEIVVVPNGEPDGTDELVAEFRGLHPSVNIRSIRSSAKGAPRARNIGLMAARHEYVTFVDDDDYVAPAFLEQLLRYAEPNVVSVAQMYDVRLNGEVVDSYVSDPIRRSSGSTLHAAAFPAATSTNAGKAVRTDLARMVSYNERLDSGEDIVFWAAVAALGGVLFRACPEADKAIYYRVLRDNSVSRQATTFDFSVRQRLDVIAELERIRADCDGPARAFIQNRINSQTAFIGNYLREFPDEHPRVVDALDRSPVFHLEYERVNVTGARGLVIAFAFPPYADPSAVVIAKRIRARGQIVDVVQNAMERVRGTDNSLKRISGPFVARTAALSTPSFFGSWSAAESFAMEGMDVVNKWRTSGRTYEWVYSRAQFAASHCLAAAVKISQPELRWIAEFSDPLSRDIRNQVRGEPLSGGDLVGTLVRGLRAAGWAPPRSDNFFVWCEEVAYALADELVFTNEAQMELMLGYCSNPALAELARRKAVVLPQPTLPAIFYAMVHSGHPVDPTMTNLAYFGNFYASRGLTDLLLAMRDLDQAERRVRLHVFTSSPTDLQASVERLKVSDLVLIRPYIPYLEFLNLATKFDCLIVNDAITVDTHLRNPFLPSKWADYRGSGRPVWGMVEVGSPLSQEALDYVSAAGDRVRTREVLRRVVEDREARASALADHRGPGGSDGLDGDGAVGCPEDDPPAVR